MFGGLSMDVLVLSTGFEPLYRVSWSKAIADTFKGRVEVIEASDTRNIGTTRGPIPMPTVVRFRSGVFAGKWRHKLGFVRLTRRTLWLRDGGCCQYCGVNMGVKSYEMEHILPKSRGGVSSWSNLVVSCPKCNQKKGSKTPIEAGMKLLSVPKKPKVSNMRQLLYKPLMCKTWETVV
jgi:5-methylcytosine-specific restriction endonuclease McrA